MKRLNYVFISVWLFSIPCFGQSGKLKVTSKDYEKWGTISKESISADGKWVSWKMNYPSGNDTIFLINRKTGKKLHFLKASSAEFSPDCRRVAVTLPGSSLKILDLASSQANDYSSVEGFTFLSTGGYVLMHTTALKKKDLLVFNAEGVKLWHSKNVAEYAIGRNDQLAFVDSTGVFVLNTKGQSAPLEVFRDFSATQTRLVWSPSGKSLAFFNRKTNASKPQLQFFNVTERTARVLDGGLLIFNNKPYNFESLRLAISPDDRQVYFNVTEEIEPASEQKLVEIWEATTFHEYPEHEFYKDPGTHPYLTVWNVDTRHLQRIDDEDMFDALIFPGGKYALGQSRLSMTARYSEIPPADYYSIHLGTQVKSLVVSQGSRSAGVFKASRSGRYLSYFKNGHHYVYDNEMRIASNITANIPVDFNDAEFDDAGPNPGYPCPGWSADSRFVILYDEYDVWLFSPDGKIADRITNGRESKTRFRLVIDKSKAIPRSLGGFSQENIDLKAGILLIARKKDKSSTYYLFNEKDGIRALNSGKFKSDRIVKADNASSYVYTEETASQPPRLMAIDQAGSKPQLICQTNSHYVHYEWSHSDLITYANCKGDSLQGILMYPAGYVSGKKYPMVVYIYERLSYQLYDYNNPEAAHRIGFAPTNYLLDGYFVLMPDIKYELGSPGPSAVDCVTAAVNCIKKKNLVDGDRIAIVGHSFGGFQAAFIVSQTNIFAAAVASGGIVDPVQAYLSINSNRLRSDCWRFEDQQYRMAGSPLDNWNDYIRNSTIAHAAKIATPLLIWSGKNDGSVDPEQSIALHLALRRLNKPNVLLLYPDQGHILTSPQAKFDLTLRVKDWLDHYLKPKMPVTSFIK